MEIRFLHHKLCRLIQLMTHLVRCLIFSPLAISGLQVLPEVVVEQVTVNGHRQALGDDPGLDHDLVRGHEVGQGQVHLQVQELRVVSSERDIAGQNRLILFHI